MARASSSKSEYLWEWKDVNDSVYTWKPYSKDVQKKLETALNRKQTATFTVNSVTYVVHVDRTPMVQLNTKTKYRREVRRRQGKFTHNRIEDQWQWVNDDNRWADYPADINQQLTAGKQKKMTSVNFQPTEGLPRNYTVDFEKMLQINLKTNYGREIRCIPVYRQDAIWQWKDDHGSFHSYNQECQDLLEDAHRNGKSSLDFTVCKRDYSVDLVSMTQTRKGFGTKRTVIRNAHTSTDGSVSDTVMVPLSPLDLPSSSPSLPPDIGNSGCDSEMLKTLGELDLLKYASVFGKEQISASEFTQLTDDDLEKLGIPLGHRKKLLSAAGKMSTSGSVVKATDEVPNEFFCPITMELMNDPVIAVDGFSYERKAIELWVAKNQVSPMTNQPLKNKDLVPNRQLKKLIDDHKAKHGM